MHLPLIYTLGLAAMFAVAIEVSAAEPWYHPTSPWRQPIGDAKVIERGLGR